MQSPRPTLELRAAVPRKVEPTAREIRHESGFFTSVDEFAGLERLDREELDDSDDV